MGKKLLTEDEFIAELLRLRPELRVEVLPDGKKIIHGIRLKTPAERNKDFKQLPFGNGQR